MADRQDSDTNDGSRSVNSSRRLRARRRRLSEINNMRGWPSGSNLELHERLNSRGRQPPGGELPGDAAQSASWRRSSRFSLLDNLPDIPDHQNLSYGAPYVGMYRTLRGTSSSQPLESTATAVNEFRRLPWAPTLSAHHDDPQNRPRPADYGDQRRSLWTALQHQVDESQRRVEESRRHLESPLRTADSNFDEPSRALLTALRRQVEESQQRVDESRRRLEHTRNHPLAPAQHHNEMRALTQQGMLSHFSRAFGDAVRERQSLQDDDSTPSDSGPPTRQPSQTPDMDSHRQKRRKVLADEGDNSHAPMRCGRRGQVEPGELRMEMVSCDGGMFSDESMYSATNILKNDSSVYCTKGSRCNIVLQHRGSCPFSLQELIIKGPSVREGMIFVAGDNDDDLKRTTQYQIEYDAPLRSLGRDEDERGHLRRTIATTQRDEGGTTSTRIRRAPHYQSNESGYRTPKMPTEFDAPRNDIVATTECSDDNVFLGSDPRSRFRRLPTYVGQQIDRSEIRPSAFGVRLEDLDEPGAGLALIEDEPTPTFSRLLQNEQNARAAARAGVSASQQNDRTQDGTTQRTRVLQRELPGSRADDDANDAEARTSSNHRAGRDSVLQAELRTLREVLNLDSDGASDELSSPAGELLVPHARFLMDGRKSTCTIRFDPPVSGRFILLKLWNSHTEPSCNIDIQSITAKGFAGPRFFPSIQLR
ncbi:regulator of chromosome condensation (RCC1) [Emericellopsis cladophorae]|uniref:Regulator of chromosome condensation (RCC1) n=1 Tax=Emericellopsis cladophorae TaxID=2686198 RepID=A0A9P9XWP5_9HYPO|nr:regulator of chromosome condensation (RCC1) [Emericellopsis cladophorae]KAI6778830.1 regulator of chromosome condensation (RCC1) [Emericellopsis cladophorae]